MSYDLMAHSFKILAGAFYEVTKGHETSVKIPLSEYLSLVTTLVELFIVACKINSYPRMFLIKMGKNRAAKKMLCQWFLYYGNVFFLN